jgi:predicted ATPase
MSMSTLSGLVAALLATLGSSATAKQPVVLALRHAPMSQVPVLRISPSAQDRRTRTCSARGSNRQANRVEKRLAPVACEQPPLSKVILTFDGGLFGSGR